MISPISNVRAISILLLFPLFAGSSYGASSGTSGTAPSGPQVNQGVQTNPSVQALPKTGSLIPHTSANLVKPKGALSKNIQKAPPKKGTGSALTTTVSGNTVISQAPSTRLNNAAAVNVMPGSGQILMQSQQMKMQDSVNRENTNSNTLANPNANFNSNTDSTVDQNGQTIIKKK